MRRAAIFLLLFAALACAVPYLLYDADTVAPRAATVAVALVVVGIAVASWTALRHRSGRRGAERAVALQPHEEQLRQILDVAPDAIVVSDESRRIELVNREAETMFGFAREQMIGADMLILVPPRLHESFIGRRRDLFASSGTGKARAERESFSARHDGAEFPVAVRHQFTQLAGRPVIVSAIRDITDQRAAAQRLIESEARLRALLESAPDAIVVSEFDGTIRVVNAATEALLGHSRGQLIGQDIKVITAPQRQSLMMENRRKLIDRSSDGGNPVDERESVVHTRDGRDFPVRLRQTVTTVDGRPMLLSVIRDISDQQAARQKIEELNDRLKRDNAALAAVNGELEAFSYSVSHDLRTPLRAIDGFSQALVEDCGDRLDETGRSHLARIRGATQRMGVLIDDLLKLARVTRAELNLGEVNLSALADDVMRDLREHEPERAVEIAIAPGLAARGDARLMRVALENLLSNAWKFTGGSAPARIEFGRKGTNGEAVYYVRDNGAGFEMAYAGKLFGAFQRLHDAGKFPGTGVGLATVQRVIRKHGGRIWAEAEPGKGATFFFTL